MNHRRTTNNHHQHLYYIYDDITNFVGFCGAKEKLMNFRLSFDEENSHIPK